MDTAVAVIWCFVLVAATTYAVSGPQVGPYDMFLTRIEPCNDEGTGEIHIESKVSYAGNGKYIHNSPFWILIPIDERLLVKLEVQKWSSQGWRPRFLLQTFKGCKSLDSVAGEFYRSFFKSAGVNITGCPFPVGNFTAKDWEVQVKLNNLNELPYNKYKTIINMYHNNTKCGCTNVFTDVVPKKMK